MQTAIDEKPLLSPRIAEIRLLAQRFAGIAKKVFETGTPVVVGIVFRDGTTISGVRLDRQTLQVRWAGNLIEAFWVKREEDETTFVWPSVESFPRVDPNGLVVISALLVPAEIL